MYLSRFALVGRWCWSVFPAVHSRFGSPFPFDVSAAQIKEARIENVFRYAHVYPRALALMGSGKLDVKPLITDRFSFADSVKAFDYALHMPPTSVKVQITVADD